MRRGSRVSLSPFHMSIKWIDGKYGGTSARVGAFMMDVLWGSSTDKYVVTLRDMGIRIAGMPDMDTAKARAEAELRKALKTALSLLGDDVAKGGG